MFFLLVCHFFEGMFFGMLLLLLLMMMMMMMMMMMFFLVSLFFCYAQFFEGKESCLKAVDSFIPRSVDHSKRISVKAQDASTAQGGG